MLDRELEHPDITRALRTGYPCGYSSLPEMPDISEAEYEEIILRRQKAEKGKKIPNEKSPYKRIATYIFC